MASRVISRYDALLNPVVDSARVQATEIEFSTTRGSFKNIVAPALLDNPDALVLLTNPVSAAEIVSAFTVRGQAPHWYLAPTL